MIEGNTRGSLWHSPRVATKKRECRCLPFSRSLARSRPWRPRR